MKNKLFKERQHYQGKDLIVVVGILITILTYQFIQDVFVSHQQNLLINVLCLGIIGGLLWWVRSLFQRQQKNVVTRKKIVCKVDSWYKQKKQIPLRDILECKVVNTPAIAQWHGVNIGLPQEEMWSINGRNGLAITTKDGQQFFIGSAKAREMAAAIKQALEEN